MTRRNRRLALIAAALLLAASRAAAGDLEQIADASDISGRVADISHATSSSGHQFRVTMSGLHYKGQVDRTLLERAETGRLTIWIAFKDVRLTIDRISVSGRPGSAVCGPLAIDIGNRRELWAAFDFDRTEAGSGALTLKQTRLGLPHDNWAIGMPAWVQTSGLFMSRDRVVSGVREGLAGCRLQIEQELRKIAHAVLGEFAAVSRETPLTDGALEDAVQAKLVSDGLLTEVGTGSAESAPVAAETPAARVVGTFSPTLSER
jgi:hypothetical protein